MNIWLGVLVNAVALLSALAACGIWTVRSVTSRIGTEMAARFDVVDVRLRALETDTTIIKQHLLSQTPAT